MARFVQSPGFEAEFLRSRIVKENLEELVPPIADDYAAGVPVATGALRDSVYADVALTDEGYRGRVGATDPKAALVELGTSEQAPDASLRNAVDAAGLDLVPHPDASSR